MRRIGLATALLLAAGGSPAASAQNGGIVLWDHHVASAMNELLVSDDPCRYGAWRLYRQTCVGNELNLSLERREGTSHTILDKAALFVHQYKDLKFRRQLSPGTKLRFKAKLSNLYQQEAEVRLSLDVRF